MVQRDEVIAALDKKIGKLNAKVKERDGYIADLEDEREYKQMGLEKMQFEKMTMERDHCTLKVRRLNDLPLSGLTCLRRPS